MFRLAVVTAVLLVAGIGYWLLVSRVTGAPEPWDAAGYWLWAYPGLLVLAAIAGPLVPGRGWLAGTILTLAQLPVVWMSSGTGSLWAVGVLYAAVLAIPAAAVSAMSGRLAARRH